jgi:hypothetical protein
MIRVAEFLRIVRRKFTDSWRSVPPPNWASSRRRAGSDHNLW